MLCVSLNAAHTKDLSGQFRRLHDNDSKDGTRQMTGGNGTMETTEVKDPQRELTRLRQEHRDLDSAIEALERLEAGDRLQIQRLKKRKLALKDQISFLEDQITPDIIA